MTEIYGRDISAYMMMSRTRLLVAAVVFGGLTVLGVCSYYHPAPPRTLKIANITDGQILSGRFIVYVQPDPPSWSNFYCRVEPGGSDSDEYWFESHSPLNRQVNGQDQVGILIDSRSFDDGKHTLTLRDTSGPMGVKTVYFRNGVSKNTKAPPATH